MSDNVISNVILKDDSDWTRVATRTYLPVQAKIIHQSFAGMEETQGQRVIEAYGAGAATLMSAGLDLRYVGVEPLTIKAGEQAMIHTGIAIYLQDPKWVGLIMPRSGMGTKGLVLGNLVGVIDADYQNEIMVCLWNRHDAESGKSITIEPGERIAQYLVTERQQLQLNFVEEFSETTTRTGGFGSTGRL